MSSAGAGRIELRGVSKRYGSVEALRPLDLVIENGEFFCLLGPSGCGKTTTLNVLGGFVPATTGEIWLGGTRVDSLPPHRRPVNTVFQSYALFPHMTVHENVRFGLRMERVNRRESEQRANEALELVGLEGYGDRMPPQLSGGQAQRVAVARALVKRPAVLLLDEPLGALDLKLRHRLQIELSQIHREVGTTFVYVTHDQEEAMSMADRIAVFCDGQIEQLGTPREIYQRPSSRFVADFIGESNFFDVTVDGDVAVMPDGTRMPCEGGRAPGLATLMVRPEAIQLGDAASANGNGLHGTALQASFLGSYVRVAVGSPAAETPIMVAAHNQDEAKVPFDREVVLTWQPEDGILLDRDSPAAEA